MFPHPINLKCRAEQPGVASYASIYEPKFRTDTHCLRAQPPTQRLLRKSCLPQFLSRNQYKTLINSSLVKEKTHSAMNVLLLLVTGMAVVKGDITPLPATRCNCFDPQDNQSLLHYLLNVTGYTDTCVAAALDSCSPLEDGHFGSLMEVRVRAPPPGEGLLCMKFSQTHCGIFVFTNKFLKNTFLSLIHIN